jgi:hypothetical protein
MDGFLPAVYIRISGECESTERTLFEHSVLTTTKFQMFGET